MNLIIKRNILRIVKWIPSSTIKIFLYKNIFGYSIGKNVLIGKVYLNGNKVIIGNNVILANYNVISCNEFEVGDGTKIQSKNIFLGCGNFKIGSNSRIINEHYFDLWNNINIGNNTWIAGKGSQFWTHGSLKTKDNADLSINIGHDVYVGSGVKFAPGTYVNNVNLVGLGAVVSGKFKESNTVIAGNLAQVIKKAIDWRDKW